ncbi:MAG: 4'-phosphopantetheinyl transferase superfamily protein, partial [Burkholderiales bacterium]
TSALVPSSHATDSLTPLLDTIVELDADHVFAHCRVGLDNDCFIRDHVLSGPVSHEGSGLHGLACVPFMVSLEIMAEACALLAGRLEVRVIENVKAFDWIALNEGALTLDVHAEVLDRERGHFAARIVTPRGMAVSAEFGFESDWRLQGVAPLKEHRPWGIDVPNMYTPGRYAMFHGPVFQSMREIAGWDDTGIDVHLSPVGLTGFFAEGHRPQLILNPVLLDALGQVVPCWLVQYVGPEFHSFPSTIGRIELYEACPADREGVVMRARQQPLNPAETDIAAPRLWQFECTDGDGRVLLRGGDMVNLFFRVTPSYHAARTYPLGGWLGAPVDLAIDDQTLLWQVPLMPEELCQQSGGICLRVLAHAVLDESERVQWRSLEGPLRRRREWLYGRAALKEAVRHWVQAQTGHLLYPSDIVVGHDAYGAPWVDGWWGDQLVAPPRVSLSHDAAHCVVAVSPSDSPVGVDFEALANERRPELLADALAPSEQSLIEGRSGSDLDERLLRLWCAKEAAAKCLGTGLQGQPWAFSITAADEGCEQLLVEHDVGVVQVRVFRHEGRILAAARLAMGQLETEKSLD